MSKPWADFLCAVQFLTRLPVPAYGYRDDSLSSAVKFFPLVGALLGAAAGGVWLLLDPHLPRLVTAAVTVAFLVLATGALHEDGLADCADGFGGGVTRERTLAIFRDSRIGSYGGAALALSLLLRVGLLAALTRQEALPVLVAAQMLCRWSTLPLSRFLDPARARTPESGSDGQGARVARLTSAGTLVFGTILTFVVAVALLRVRGLTACASACVVTGLTGLYYRRRLGGVTGDCFGATNQLTELAVYVCAVWV